MKRVVYLVAWLVLPMCRDAATADAAPLELVQTIPLKGAPGRLDHLALDAVGNRLFIANLSNNSLDVVDLKAGKLIEQVTGQQKIQGIAYVPDLNRIFVGNGTDGVCNIFDGKSFKLLRSLKLDDADNVRYDRRSKQIYVAHAENSLAVIDPKTMEVKTTIKLPGAPEAFQIDPSRPRLCVNIPNPSQVAIVDTDKNVVVTTVPMTLAASNYPMALDVARQQVFVGCRRKPAVEVIDVVARKELYSTDIAGDVDDLFFDAKSDRLYAICGEGFLVVLVRDRTGRFAGSEKIPTRKQARTGLFDPNGARLFMVLPRLGNDDLPLVRVYSTKTQAK